MVIGLACMHVMWVWLWFSMVIYTHSRTGKMLRLAWMRCVMSCAFWHWASYGKKVKVVVTFWPMIEETYHDRNVYYIKMRWWNLDCIIKYKYLKFIIIWLFKKLCDFLTLYFLIIHVWLYRLNLIFYFYKRYFSHKICSLWF